MRTMLTIGLLGTVLLGGACWADTSGSAYELDVMSSLYAPDAKGNQTWVREYDGRTFSFGSVEELNLMGYNGPMQYSLEGRDWFIGDEFVLFSVATGNSFAATFSTDAMTHRLARIPSVNPFLSDTPAAGGDDVLDLSVGQPFEINRRVNSLYVRSTPLVDRAQRMNLNWWQETESGSEQLMFRAREAKPNVIANRARATVGIPVNRDTTEVTLGPDLKIGSLVVNYRYDHMSFRDDAGRPATGSNLDFLPLNKLTQIKATTNSQIVKTRAKITDRLHFTGAYINRSRRNTAATAVDRTAVNISSTNAALVYYATDALWLTGRYRRLDQNNEVGFLFSGDSIENQQLSRETTAGEVEATYTGIPRTFVRLNYERRDTNRDLRSLHSVHEEFEHPLVNESTRSNIYRATVRFHPGTRFSASGRFESWDTTSPGYPTVPTDRQRVNANATYLLANNAAIYGDYSKWKETNNVIQAPVGAIPTPAGDAAGRELRQEAAGQGYDNDSTIATIGAWYALSSKLVFDAYYAKTNMNTATLWVIGVDPSFPPHLPATVAQYEADMRQISVGATYVVNRKLRLYGRFVDSHSKGRTALDSADFPSGVGSTWMPVDVVQKQWTLGLGYDLGPKDSLQADFSLGDWQDAIDSDQDGTFKLWRLAWTHRF